MIGSESNSFLHAKSVSKLSKYYKMCFLFCDTGFEFCNHDILMVKNFSSVFLSKSFLSFLEITLILEFISIPELPFFDKINFLRKMFLEGRWIVCV